MLGFVGSPWTLATYLIEGGSTPLYKKIKTMTQVRNGATGTEVIEPPSCNPMDSPFYHTGAVLSCPHLLQCMESMGQQQQALGCHTTIGGHEKSQATL